MSAALPPRYRAEPEEQRSLQTLDDIALLYHRRSGQTHMMISPAPEILGALDGLAAASAADIAVLLAADYDLGDPVEAEAAIAVHLAELTALGLAHRA